MTKEPPYSVPMPKRLGKCKTYNPKTKCYCAAGYLMRHIGGYSRAKVQREFVWRFFEEFIPEFMCGSGVVARNDNAKNNAARLEEFRKTCEIAGIKIIERGGSIRG